MSEAQQESSGRRAEAVATAISRLHREHYGRGASTARALIQRNYVVVFLEDIYTPGERTLIEAGDFDTVQETRDAFQRAMRPTFTDAVERIMGRKVVAFLSQVHVDPDLSVETFVLESDGIEAASADVDGGSPPTPREP
jgi:uncharacterized protein YbcI